MPLGWLFLFVVMVGLLANDESMYDHEVKYYELITPHIVLSETGPKQLSELAIQFRAFNRSFYLLLHEDLEFRNLAVESLEAQGPTKAIGINFTFFEGAEKGTTDSVVAGYLCGEVFCGTFEEDGVIYFMESAEVFFKNSSYSGRAVIYRRQDVEGFVQDEEGTHGFKGSQKHRTSNPYLSLNLLFPSSGNFFGPLYRYSKGIDKSAKPDADYACQIEMVADHTLYQYFNKKMDELSAFLYLHAKYADSVFRKTDFDGDGYKDNIRIVVKKVFVYKSANDADYPMAKADDTLEFLKKFTRRIQNYCLSVCMCDRRFTSLAIGRAYKPTSGIRGTPGGICEKALKLKDGLTFRLSSLNTAVVTLRNVRGQTLPQITTLLAITHEIGHSFGSDHDPLDNLLCSPGGDKGYYLMHPKTTKELKEFSNQFSPCSRQDIHRTLQDRGECLKVHPTGTCGNGIREGEEECDCGWDGTCKALDPCCTPSDAKSPEKPCTFRRSAGAQCSPKESPCCTEDCSLGTSNDTVCYQSDAKCLVSHCTANSSTCPVPQQAPDGYPCQSTSKTCLGGTCNSSVCLDNGLKACTCKEKDLACFVCCEKDDQCQPAHKIGLKNPWAKVFVAMAGSHCNGSENLSCDSAGNCVDVKDREIDDKVKGKALWWTMTIFIIVFIILITIFLYLLKSHLGY